MTDYRSLEQKVRDLVREQTNSQKRETVTNVGRPNTPAPETKVGRPDTAESPLSTKSTLARTAEIQRKVIEGNQMMYSDKTFGLPSSVIDAARSIMVNEADGAETLQHAQAKTVVGGKTKVIINPKTSDRSDDDTLDSGRKTSTVKESILDGMTLVEGAKTHFNVGSKKLSLAKGDPVTFRHFRTGERVTGTFHSKTMIGGLPYVHVHLPDNTSMAVPPHQVINNYDANEMPQPIKPVKEDVAEGKRIGPEWEKSSPEERKSTVKKEAKEISAKTGGEVKESSDQLSDSELTRLEQIAATLELDEAKRGRPAKNAGPAAPSDGEKHEHPIMQLRKAIATNGKYQITHLNGQKTNVTPQLAQHALNIHNSLKTAEQKQKLADAIHASHDSMKKALS